MKAVMVKDNPTANRYEVWVADEMAELAYQRKGNQIVFVHTRVPPSLEGRGLGSALARRALDDARAEGLRLTPLCPFVRGYLINHPDYQDDPGFYQILARFPEAVQEMAVLARGLIIAMLPEVVEMPWVDENILGFGDKAGKYTDHFCWLTLIPDGLTIHFRADLFLPDPSGLLQPYGFVSIQNAKDLRNPALHDLLTAAKEG